MKALFFLRNLLFCLALSILINPQLSLIAEVMVEEVETEVITTEEVSTSTLPPAAITIGGRFSSDDNMGMLDVLVPIVGNDSCFLFLDPRVAQQRRCLLSEGAFLSAPFPGTLPASVAKFAQQLGWEAMDGSQTWDGHGPRSFTMP